MKTWPQHDSSPVVILATEILDDISELCEQMALLNHHKEGLTFGPGERVNGHAHCREVSVLILGHD